MKYYGDRLRLARLLCGFKQQELGERVSVSRQFIHQLESGVKEPAENLMNALCEVLKVERTFFQVPLTNDVKFEQCHFRKRSTTPIGLANRVQAFSTIFEELITLINTYLEFPRNTIPCIEAKGVHFTNEEIEKAAETCRIKWELGIDTPISRMTRVLENAGVVITQFKGVSEKVDALSLNRKYPIIIRNQAKESSCRMRFDLAHECGHFVLHDGIETGDSITEREADRFAGAFLFPRVAFVKEFGQTNSTRLNWEHIYNLKLRWGMSARAIVYRAHQLGLISSVQYRSANVFLSRSGQSKVENFDEQIPQEKPELLEKALRLLRKETGITFSQLASKIGIYFVMLKDITDVQTDDGGHSMNVIPFQAKY